MLSPNLRSLVERARSSPLVRVIGFYVIAAWAVLQAIDLFTAQFGLPGWFFTAALVLLLIGLPIVTATSVVQTALARRQRRAEESTDEVTPEPEGRGALERLFTWRYAILGGVLAFMALGTIGMGVAWVRVRGQELRADAVAVMPFHVVGEDVELWREGLVDLLATALDATGQFHSSDPRAVLNRWNRAARSAAELPEPGKAAEVAGSLGAGRVILGSLIRIPPNGVRLAADLYTVRWLHKEASAAVEGREDEMTALVDRLTLELLRRVWQGDSLPEVRVSAMTTSSIPALRAYLEGEQAFRRMQFADAQGAFTRAIEADSSFAIAHYRLAQTFGWFRGLGASEVPRHLASAERHSSGLPQRDSLLIRGWKLADVDGDLDAIPLFRNLVERYPDDVEAWHGLGDALFHMGAQIGQPITAAIEPLERTLEIDSTFAPSLIHLIELAYLLDDSERGRRWTERYLALDSTSLYGRSFRTLTALHFGSAAESARAASALDTLDAELLHWMTARMRGSGSNLPIYEMVTLALADERFVDADRAMAFWHLAEAHLRYGHVAVAVDLFEQVTTLANGFEDDVLFVMANARELGIAGDSASNALVERLSKAVDRPIPALAVSDVRYGAGEQADATVAWLEAKADSAEKEGYSERARSLRGQALTLSGRIAAARDSVETGIARLRRGLAMINATWNRSRDLDRYWLAYLVEGRGGDLEALTIYGSLYWNPWIEPLAYYHRAELHERRGEFDDAARFYARFLELWSDADPHLQPRVEAARLALQRLRGADITS